MWAGNVLAYGSAFGGLFFHLAEARKANGVHRVEAGVVAKRHARSALQVLFREPTEPALVIVFRGEARRPGGENLRHIDQAHMLVFASLVPVHEERGMQVHGVVAGNLLRFWQQTHFVRPVASLFAQFAENRFHGVFAELDVPADGQGQVVLGVVHQQRLGCALVRKLAREVYRNNKAQVLVREVHDAPFGLVRA